MLKSLFIILLILFSFNTYASSYYKTGKLYNVNELVNNVNQDIENYCKRNLNEFNRNMEEVNDQRRNNSRYQLKTTLPSNTNSRQEKLNLEACFNVEKQKFNNIVNIYYNNNNENEFLNCYEKIRDDRTTSIADNFSNCISENRKEKCKDIIQADISPEEKAIMYRNCLM